MTIKALLLLLFGTFALSFHFVGAADGAEAQPCADPLRAVRRLVSSPSRRNKVLFSRVQHRAKKGALPNQLYCLRAIVPTALSGTSLLLHGLQRKADNQTAGGKAGGAYTVLPGVLAGIHAENQERCLLY